MYDENDIPILTMTLEVVVSNQIITVHFSIYSMSLSNFKAEKCSPPNTSIFSYNGLVSYFRTRISYSVYIRDRPERRTRREKITSILQLQLLRIVYNIFAMVCISSVQWYCHKIECYVC